MSIKATNIDAVVRELQELIPPKAVKPSALITTDTVAGQPLTIEDFRDVLKYMLAARWEDT